MDFATLEALRRSHPAWRLLTAEHAPLIVSFLEAAFLAGNERSISHSELASRLDDVLHALNEARDPPPFPRPSRVYLDEWASDGRGFLRKFYPPGADEPHFDLTPATEKAIEWLRSLTARRFVGTESRLLTVLRLLEEMTGGAELDAGARLTELEKKRAALDEEIARVKAGDVRLMDDSAIKDRFLQMAATARGLLSDFRELEQSFIDLDRLVRERIATWEGSRGELLQKILGERDQIADSDQGRSFRGFYDFLMSPARQDELTERLEKVLALDAVKALAPDERLKRIHYDWLQAGEVTQRRVARLSEQLRRYLDDQAFLENKRIMMLVRQVEQHALAFRDRFSSAPGMEIDDFAPEISLPLERKLFSPPAKARLAEQVVVEGEATFSAERLFAFPALDKARLRDNVDRALRARSQVSLGEVISMSPLSLGLAELVGYLSVASEAPDSAIEDARTETISWTDGAGVARRASIPLVVFSR